MQTELENRTWFDEVSVVNPVRICERYQLDFALPEGSLLVPEHLLCKISGLNARLLVRVGGIVCWTTAGQYLAQLVLNLSVVSQPPRPLVESSVAWGKVSIFECS